MQVKSLISLISVMGCVMNGMALDHSKEPLPDKHHNSGHPPHGSDQSADGPAPHSHKLFHSHKPHHGHHTPKHSHIKPQPHYKRATSNITVLPSKPICRSTTYLFNNKTRVVPFWEYNGKPSSADFLDLSGSSTQWEIDNNKGLLVMKLIGPKDPQNHGDYNGVLGRGMTWNSTTTIFYGSITYEMTALAPGGAVTAGILLSDGGDEIDIEFVGKDLNRYQSNMYYRGIPEYGTYASYNPVSGKDITGFHKYRIDWTPDNITWSVDGRFSKIQKRTDTLHKDGLLHFPSQPAHLQFGTWDGSGKWMNSWANGPINWTAIPSKTLKAYMKSIKVECNPRYNTVIR